MAIRSEDLMPWAPVLARGPARAAAVADPGPDLERVSGSDGGPGARIYRFPTLAIRARRARRRAIFRRRAALGAITVLITASFLAATGPEGSAPAASNRPPDRVVVRAGDTLWDLAARYAPPGIDIRAYVDAVIALNRLDGGLEAGATIELPR